MTAKKRQAPAAGHGVSHRTRGQDNLFSDLGFGAEDAARLQVAADRAIQQRMALREALADAVVDWINEHELKQAEAAEILHISRPRVSDLVRRQITKFSVDTLVDLVGRTGKTVYMQVG